MPNRQRLWTTGELQFLRDHAQLGADELARRMGRTRYSVECAAGRFRISLRPPGTRTGRLLGQPRGVSLRRDMREALLAHPDLVAERLRMDHDAELCPFCAVREIAVPSTGLCRPCHMRRLSQAHRDALAERDAGRELWAERQRLHRARAGGAAEPGE